MAFAKNSSLLIDEMSIVDVFTRLIFDANSALDDREALMVDLLVELDHSLVRANRRDISEYLSSMGVDEMIKAVSQIKRQLEQQQELIAVNKHCVQQPLHR